MGGEHVTFTHRIDCEPFPRPTVASDDLRHFPLEHHRILNVSSFVGIMPSLAVMGTCVEVGVGSGALANEVNVAERRELICTSLTDALDLR